MHSEEQFESQHGLKGRNSLETDRQKGVLFVLEDSLLTSGRHKVIQMEFCDNTENINVVESMIYINLQGCVLTTGSWTDVIRHSLIDSDKQ